MEQLRKSKRLQQKQNSLTLSGDKTHTQNITQHPLLNELVLENVFRYLKGQSNATTLVKYRTVSKKWYEEIAKFLRKDTQIDLTKILSPYPDGLGWTASAEDSAKPFYYDVPYPKLRSFENVLVIAITCESVKNQKWADWFQIMGSQVKGLKLSSPFTCFCQNRFLENILKEWCPNLVRLELCNVKCVASLLNVSSFSQTSKSIICRALKELKIHVDGDEPHSISCEIYNYANVWKILMRIFSMNLLVPKLLDIIYNYGLSSGNSLAFPDIVDLSTENAPWLHEVTNENIHAFAFQLLKLGQRFGPSDGGIVGQLMNEIHLKKLDINTIANNARDFATFFHLQPNQWRVSLKELELDENLSKSLKELHVIALVKFPLTSIKLCGLHAQEYDAEMTRFLQYFADTLERLEFSGASVQQEVRTISSKLSLPFLPNLKTFVHDNISACFLSADNLWKNAPNLKRCLLKGSSVSIWDGNRFFENSDAVSINSMKEFALVAQVNSKQAVMILDWFPNLSKLELSLDIFALFSEFFGKVEKSNIEHLKLAYLKCVSEELNSFLKWNTGTFPKLSSLKGLKSLELHNMSALPIRVTPSTFSEVGTLTSLNLVGFHIYTKEKEALLKNLVHIPAVKFVNIIYLPISTV